LAENRLNSTISTPRRHAGLRAQFAQALRSPAGFVAATLLFTSSAALALEPSTPLASYGRQAWVLENGLPQNTVQALVQTEDGFVWLGTEVGLVRFDGISFQLFDRNTAPAIPGNDVRCLLAGRDGALWIGTSEGLARWKNGTITAFTTKEGLPSNAVTRLSWNSPGNLAVTTAEGVANFNEGRFARVTTESSVVEGVPEIPTGLSKGERATGSKSEVTLWRGPNPIAKLNVGKELPGSRIQAIFADRQGSLWIGTNNGLARWADDKVQQLPVNDPLASASVEAFMEDREGSVWVGTESDGLHILRDQRFRTLTTRDGHCGLE
jgi:ligand-binding sensor domain-containing protein